MFFAPLALALAGGSMLGACSVNYLDPCQRLAYRICGCELTQAQQQNCQSQRISQQQDTLSADEAEAARCLTALDTCTCEALDANRTDLCGFTRDEGDEVIIEPQPEVDTADGEPA